MWLQEECLVRLYVQSIKCNERMKHLFFSTNIYGHFVEYIHHICVAADGDKDKDIYIVVPSTFIEKKELLLWPDSNNIHFEYFEESTVDTGHFFLDSYNAARILGKKVRAIRPDSVFLLAIMQVMPFVVFFVPWTIKVSGIIYSIYLYKWKSESWKKKIEDVVKYILFSKCPIFKSIYILNDSASAAILNKIWSTQKFCYLSDPCPELNNIKLIDIQSQLQIDNNKKVFLHFGSLTKRKGTLMIFDLISRLSDEVLEKTCFIFAGKVWDDIKQDFYQQYDLLKSKTQIVVFDQFCTYDFLGSLCKSSDYIILPYMNTSNSSGVISYGALFNVPIIVPEHGMVPKLIKKFKMGVVVKGSFINQMVSLMPLFLNSNLKCSNSYYNNHKVQDFVDVIMLGK